jgi:preprotein translocase subunit SecA
LEDRLKDEEENTFRLTVGMLHYIVDIDIDLKKFKIFITENTDEKSIGEYIIISIISKISINFIDKYWQEHLMRIEDLKTAVQNAYYEQKDPLLVFKFESFKVFKSMIIRIYYDIMEFIFKCKTLNKEEKDKYLSELKKDESDYAKEILYRDIFHQMKKKMKVLMN